MAEDLNTEEIHEEDSYALDRETVEPVLVALRDGDSERYLGKGVTKAVDAVIGEQALGLAEAVGGVIEEAEPEAEKSSKFDDAFGAEPDEETPVTGLGKGR